MSLYYEASTLLINADNVGGSLKSRVRGNKSLKSSPAQVYALLTEASKWSSVLKDVIERSELLKAERKVETTFASHVAIKLPPLGSPLNCRRGHAHLFIDRF